MVVPKLQSQPGLGSAIPRTPLPNCIGWYTYRKAWFKHYDEMIRRITNLMVHIFHPNNEFLVLVATQPFRMFGLLGYPDDQMIAMLMLMKPDQMARTRRGVSRPSSTGVCSERARRCHS